MNTGIDRLASQLQKTITERDKSKKTGYYARSEVVKVDDDVVWVKIPGGIDETPVAKTTDAKVGDKVQVRVEGGRAWIAGNYTSPPTDDTKANSAYQKAETADENANTAKHAAQAALRDAQIAHEAAEDAVETAELVHGVAVKAEMDAKNARSAADSATLQLSLVEDIVGTVTWLSEHGNFEPTEDTIVNPEKRYYAATYDYLITGDTDIDIHKTYYIRNGSGTDDDPYTYVAVDSPDSAHLSEYYERTTLGYEYIKVDDMNPHEAGLYELTSMDEAVTNYINARLALTNQGLWVTADEDNEYRLLLSSDGIYLYGPTGVISKFGEGIDFSSGHSQHIGGENSYIEFDSETGKVNIVTDQLMIGAVNPIQKFEQIEQNVIPDIQGTINEHSADISAQKDTLYTLTGYVDINSAQSYIRVGKKGADSYVQIDGADTKVAINIEGQDVAYMSGDRFYAPSAVVTTLYMKTELNSDNAIGTIGWIMRSNGHLSLKRVK